MWKSTDDTNAILPNLFWREASSDFVSLILIYKNELVIKRNRLSSSVISNLGGEY